MTASEQSRSTTAGTQGARVSLVGLAQEVGSVRDDEDSLTTRAMIRLAGGLDTTVAERIQRIRTW